MAGASVLWLNQAASKVIINKIAIVQGIEPWIMFPQNKAFQLSLSYTNPRARLEYDLFKRFVVTRWLEYDLFAKFVVARPCEE